MSYEIFKLFLTETCLKCWPGVCFGSGHSQGSQKIKQESLLKFIICTIHSFVASDIPKSVLLKTCIHKHHHNTVFPYNEIVITNCRFCCSNNLFFLAGLYEPLKTIQSGVPVIQQLHKFIT